MISWSALPLVSAFKYPYTAWHFSSFCPPTLCSHFWEPAFNLWVNWQIRNVSPAILWSVTFDSNSLLSIAEFTFILLADPSTLPVFGYSTGLLTLVGFLSTADIGLLIPLFLTSVPQPAPGDFISRLFPSLISCLAPQFLSPRTLHLCLVLIFCSQASSFMYPIVTGLISCLATLIWYFFQALLFSKWESRLRFIKGIWFKSVFDWPAWALK